MIFMSLISLVLQPAEMSLEEIESRLGSLIQGDTIGQLKSAVWKERLEGGLLESFQFSILLYFLCIYLIRNRKISLKQREHFQNEKMFH